MKKIVIAINLFAAALQALNLYRGVDYPYSAIIACIMTVNILVVICYLCQVRDIKQGLIVFIFLFLTGATCFIWGTKYSLDITLEARSDQYEVNENVPDIQKTTEINGNMDVSDVKVKTLDELYDDINKQ